MHGLDTQPESNNGFIMYEEQQQHQGEINWDKVVACQLIRQDLHATGEFGATERQYGTRAQVANISPEDTTTD